jgi:hypothetical protein
MGGLGLISCLTDYCTPGKGQEKGGVENLVGTYDAISSSRAGEDFTHAYLVGCCERDPHERTRWGKRFTICGLRRSSVRYRKRCRRRCLCNGKVNRRQMVRFASNCTCAAAVCGEDRYRQSVRVPGDHCLPKG